MLDKIQNVGESRVLELTYQHRRDAVEEKHSIPGEGASILVESDSARLPEVAQYLAEALMKIRAEFAVEPDDIDSFRLPQPQIDRLDDIRIPG